MKKPSRHMPKYNPPKMGIISWTVLFLFLAGMLFCIWYVHWSLVVFGFPVFLLYSNFLVKKHKAMIHNIAQKRVNEDIGTFARKFDCREIDTWVIRAVYEQIQEYLKTDYPQFPLRPEDRIYEDLVIDPDDFDMDILEEISQRTGKSLKDIDKNPYAQSLKTVEDVVFMINDQPFEENVPLTSRYTKPAKTAPAP